jgi:hypothetical protein
MIRDWPPKTVHRANQLLILADTGYSAVSAMAESWKFEYDDGPEWNRRVLLIQIGECAERENSEKASCWR